MESAADKIKKEKEQERLLTKAVTSLKDFLQKELPPNKWVVDGLIPEGMTILSSAPGQFKTYLLLALAKQISNGEMAFNHFKSEKKNILFVNEEMGERAIQDRLKNITGEFDGFYMTNLAGVKLDHAKTLLKICKEKDITLVIFDSLTRIHALKENDADDVKKIFEAALVLLKEGISIVMTHHHRKAPMFGAKNGSEEMRGSIDILAQIDCHIAVDAVALDKSYVVLKQLKIRIAENLPDFKVGIIKSDTGALTFKYKGNFSKMDETMQKIQENKEAILKVIEENPGCKKSDIIQKVTGKIGVNLVESILPELEKSGVIYSMGNKPKMYYIKAGNPTLI